MAMLAAYALLTLPSAHADIVIIVSPANPLFSRTAEQTAHIFSGKRMHFLHESEAVPVDLPEGSPPRENFYRKLLGKAPAMMKTRGAKMDFTSKGSPPKETADTTAAKKLITSHPKYIGYLAQGEIDMRVKVITVLRGMDHADVE